MSEEQEYVVAIAQYGSISKAAQAVNITQPGLSQRLKRIEAELGAELFDRTSQPLKLTPSGEVYLRYALQSIAAEESMRRDVYSVANRKRQRLRVGVSMPRASSLLSKPIMSFYESHQGCTLEFVELEDIERLHSLFLGDAIDFAVLTPFPPDSSMYEAEALWKERLVLVASSQLSAPQLAGVEEGSHVKLTDLEGLPFVLPTCGRYLDPLIDRVIASTDARLDIAVRGCGTDLALRLVGEGLGVSMVPSTSLFGVTGLSSYELDGMVAAVDLNYIRYKDTAVCEEERLFMSILKSWIDEKRA